MRWDESNCSFNENPFVKKAYEEKKWGFIGDYYRLSKVYEYGGIYLDTDVEINKTFDDLLDNKAFIGFMNDYEICTAIIGAEKHSSFIYGLMSMYDKSEFYSKESMLTGIRRNIYDSNFTIPSNDSWSWYILENYPDIKLESKEPQIFQDVLICPKEYFEIGDIFGNYYSRHVNTGTWREKEIFNIRHVFRFLKRNKIMWLLITHFTYRKYQYNAIYKYWINKKEESDTNV